MCLYIYLPIYPSIYLFDKLWIHMVTAFILKSVYHPQFSSVTQLCLTLCNSMDCSMPGSPVHHQLLELDQTYVHRVGDASSHLNSTYNKHQEIFPVSERVRVPWRYPIQAMPTALPCPDK